MGQLQYKPFYRHFRLNQNIYHVIDTIQAESRALYFSLQADVLDEQDQNKDYYLRLATDYGCTDSPHILAKRILNQACASIDSQDDAIIFLNIAAQRGNKEAAHKMASCYAGRNEYPEIMAAGAEFFAALTDAERELLAQYYTEMHDD